MAAIVRPLLYKEPQAAILSTLISQLLQLIQSESFLFAQLFHNTDNGFVVLSCTSG